MKGRVALVTGGTAGIGWATAEELLSCGVKVIICSRPGDNLNNAERILKDSRRANVQAFAADVSSEEDVGRLVEFVQSEHGQLDYLVNNAGIDGFLDMNDFRLEDWRQVLNVNLLSIYLVTAAALPLLKKSSSPAIVNVGSVHGHVTGKGRSAYSASKSAVTGATRSLGLDLGEHGIRVNAVSPGVIRTPMLERNWHYNAPNKDLAEIEKQAAKYHLTKRIGEPEDVAKVIRFLLSDDARFISGTDILVDGGIHARIALSTIWET